MPQGKQILWYVSMALYSTYFRHVLYEWEWISLNLLAWAVQVCAYNWQSQQVLCVNDNFFYIEISWCEKFFSVFCFFFFPNVDVCNLEYDICLQWDGFALFLVIDMSMNTENRLSKVVSEWSLYGMSQIRVFDQGFCFAQCCTQRTLVSSCCSEFYITVVLWSFWTMCLYGNCRTLLSSIQSATGH